MTFYQYLITNYLGKDTPEGDLAEDTKRLVKSGKINAGRLASKREAQGMRFLHMMTEQGACEEAMHVAIRLITEYRSKECISKKAAERRRAEAHEMIEQIAEKKDILAVLQLATRNLDEILLGDSRASTALKSYGIKTLSDLLRKHPEEIQRIRGIGRKTLYTIEDSLRLTIGDDLTYAWMHGDGNEAKA